MKYFVRLIAIMAIIASVGCATLPPPDQMKAQVESFELPKVPEEGKAVAYIVRPSSLGTLIRFNVFVDDQEPESEMGYTRGSQYIYFNLDPGKHKIFSKAENWAETILDVAAGDIVFIQQDPVMGLVMARNNLIKVEDYVGKYHVKTLELGTILRSERGAAQTASASEK